jgi:eukaryotic-like serine/threonine-protein kinase
MRKRLLIAGSLGLVVLAGIGTALLLLATREPPSGKLDTALTDVSVITATTPPPTETVPTAPAVDKRCWNMFGGSPRRDLARLSLRLGVPVRPPLWARALNGYIEYQPSYCDGTLYVNTVRGDTWAVEAATGKVLWRRRSLAQKPSTPAIAGRYVLVSSKDGTVTALDRSNGRQVWQIRTQAKVESSPAVVDGTAYFGATDGHLFAVNARTGRIRWAYDTGGRINASPSVLRDRVCISTYAGSIFCLRRSNGHKLWSTFVKRDAFRYESFYASPSTDGRRLYTIARSGKIVALSVASGRVLWTQHVNSLGYSTPAIAGPRIFVGGFDGALHAYRASTGAELWRARVGGRVLGAPIVVGNLVFFSTLEQKTYAARVATGKVVWRIGIGKYSPGIATERAYYFTLNGILVAFRGRNSPD